MDQSNSTRIATYFTSRVLLSGSRKSKEGNPTQKGEESGNDEGNCVYNLDPTFLWIVDHWEHSCPEMSCLDHSCDQGNQGTDQGDRHESLRSGEGVLRVLLCAGVLLISANASDAGYTSFSTATVSDLCDIPKGYVTWSQ